jgi:hypothetical protein
VLRLRASLAVRRRAIARSGMGTAASSINSPQQRDGPDTEPDEGETGVGGSVVRARFSMKMRGPVANATLRKCYAS